MPEQTRQSPEITDVIASTEASRPPEQQIEQMESEPETKRTNKWSLIGVIVLILGLVGLGLWSVQNGGRLAENKQTKSITSKLEIGGSGSGMGVLEAVATDFKVSHPGVAVEFAESVGTAGAIKEVYAGRMVMGATARPPKPQEQATTPVNYYPIARDLIILATHPTTGVEELTSQEIRDIYTGKLTDWQQVGGANLPIRVLGRTADETPTQVIKQGVLAEVEFSPQVEIISTATAMAEAIVTDEGVIGYTSLGMINSLGQPYNLIGINGQKPDDSAREKKDSKYVIELGVVIKGEASGLSQLFLEYLQSEAGKAAIEKAGYEPF